MPELPDITIYTESLTERIVGQRLLNLRITSPFLVRTVTPSVDTARDLRVVEVRRLGKRIAIGFEDGTWWVIHLMIAGRLRWRDEEPRKPGRSVQALFVFESGVLLLTEAGKRKRASIHVAQDEQALNRLNPGGLEIFDSDEKAFASALQASNHTLKRALTDPRILSGIGNAYSDEILHRAKLSPVAMTQSLSDEDIATLFCASKDVLTEWTERLRDQADGDFPEKVTAFRPEMAVHGKFGEPCPVCDTTVQKISYASNETNYCPRCQTDGKMLADRALSQLLKKDWPKSIDDWEEKFR